MFILAIIMSFIPELFPKIFGDWLCNGTIHYAGAQGINDCMYYNEPHSPMWHWGYRHWIWFLMGASLAFLQVRDIISKLIDD